MSDDPETRRQIAALAHGTRPLLVCDVDDVVLEFLRPFIARLGTLGLTLRFDSFRLHGNIRDGQTGDALAADKVTALIDDFFAEQDGWQEPVEGAIAALQTLHAGADIVLLTAMPHRHFDRRAAHLASRGIPYPLITTEMAKGPAVAALRGRQDRPVAFIDDIAANHKSVAQAVPDAGLVHISAYRDIVPALPPIPEGVHDARDWPAAKARIAAHLGL